MAEEKSKSRSDMTDREKIKDAQTNPLQPRDARPKAEVVAEAYEHEDPTPTQEENDAAKLAAIGTGDQPPPVDPGAPIDQAAHKRESDKRSAEADKPGSYSTRSTAKPE